jgi:HK97 gp10 family phage protein
MKFTMKLEGLKEIDEALGDLPRATSKNVLRRTARKVLEPFAEDMRALAPHDKGKTRNSITVGSRLSRRQAAEYRKMFKDDRASIEMHAGPGPTIGAVTQEFGTVQHPPQPFARPSWDKNKGPAVTTIKQELWAEVEKAAKRHARKMARLAKTRG